MASGMFLLTDNRLADALALLFKAVIYSYELIFSWVPTPLKGRTHKTPPDARPERLAQALAVSTLPASGPVPAMALQSGAGAKGCFLSEPTPSSLWMQMAM